MKNSILLYLILLILVPLTGSGQTEKEKTKVTDTIYFFGDKTIAVNVLKITRDSIIYKEAGQSTQKKLDQRLVNKIKYNFGKVEIINSSPKKENEKLDWRKVKVLRYENQVKGMIEVEKIKATAEGSGRGFQSPKTLKTKALTILRKKSAQLNARYLLITDENIAAGFGDIPSVTYKGIAYKKKE